MLEQLGLPSWALWAVGGLILVQITLQIIALVDLARRPVEQVKTGKKLVWVLVIVLLEVLGPIIYFVAGRAPVQVADAAKGAAVDEGRAQRAADVLYGREEPPNTTPAP